MTEIELKNKLQELLKLPKETEWVEFKEVKNGTFSQDKIGQYNSALSNEVNLRDKDFGWLVFGVDNNKNIVGTNYRKDNLDDIKYEIYQNSNLSFKEVYQIFIDQKRVVMFQIIPAQKGQPTKWKGFCYGREGGNLVPLSDEKYQRILKQTQTHDWSALPCEEATIEDLDEEAILILREKLTTAKNNNEYKNLEIKNLLNRVNLLTEDKINNTCLLFLGKPETTDEFLFDKNKISWVYRDELNEIEERFNIDEIRKPFIILLPEIQKNIQRFNTYLKDLDLFREDIRQYDEKAVEELLVNSIAHRDWEIRLWIEVVQTPNKLEIRNPGNFLADWDKVLKYNQKPPYKNPNLVTFLNHIKLMEREGDGLRKVYKAQVGKGLEVIKRTEVPDRVDVILTGKVKNIEFAKFVLTRRVDIEIDDIRILEKIARGENRLERDILTGVANDLKSKGLIDIDWKRKICNFSYNFSKNTGLLGKRRRFEKLTKTQEEAEIINFLTENEIGEVKKDFMQIFEHKGYTHDMVYNIIRRLKSQKKVLKVGKFQWKLTNNVNNETTATNASKNSN